MPYRRRRRALGIRVLRQIRHNDDIHIVPIDTGILAAARQRLESHRLYVVCHYAAARID